ncbi:DOT1-domain-containing protein [Lophium mytilinum]|uniref:Histone-lysine N-methyltransferase, H3 lysine-79 specific n=1 Tax=Lophium mytilinum TaxID=390894 RepID=A0A6A6QEP3_9PEZI|nr:DOT1-domain-containing protein [Lophium mytilinum]
MFSNKKKEPRIRTITRVKEQKDLPKPPQPAHNPKPTSKSPASFTQAHRKAEKAHQKAHNGYSNGHAPPTKTSQKSDFLAVRHPSHKRKSSTPLPQFASSDESEEDSANGSRKRHKTSSSIEPDSRRMLEPDMKRRIRDEGNKGEKLDMMHGLDMTAGEHGKEYNAAFKTEAGEEDRFVVELQYPSASPPERFQTVTPRDVAGYDPIKDIEYTIDEICLTYLPEAQSLELRDDDSGIVRLLKRAVSKKSPSDYRKALDSFNAQIRASLADSTISKTLDSKHALPPSLVNHILSQVYQRIVSPHAHRLKKVKDKATTYGELMPSFVNTIFRLTKLNSSSIFVDLGSGVGNVVIQAALQTGAKSWGIEILDTPAKFASEQAKELQARARLWGLSLGDINLLHGSFLESPDINEVLKVADVVLVNNKVFGERLNEELVYKFLDLKDGAQVISLESFGASRQGRNAEQNPTKFLRVERYESGTDAVSWDGQSVDYFIATKHSDHLKVEET